jgi:hypothetical protein
MDFQKWWATEGHGLWREKFSTSDIARAAWDAATRAERERICAAIKAEDDYCSGECDYMLDSDDCIAVAQGRWVRRSYG